MRYLSALPVTAWLFLFDTSSAHAYLDPGTGSMILQIILGGVAGLMVALRLYWHRILAVLGIKSKAIPERISTEKQVPSNDRDDSAGHSIP
ncbi:MAG: hypothetical protein WAN46_16145 [Gammaproteobacteria bacterium]